MTLAGRLAAVLVAVAGIVVAAAALVREVALAAGGGTTWVLSGWAGDLTQRPSDATWLAAGIAFAAAGLLLVAAFRQLAAADGGSIAVHFEAGGGYARLDARVLERSLRQRFERELSSLRVKAVRLTRDGDEWRVAVVADVAGDLVGARARMEELAAADLMVTAGLHLTGLDLTAARLGARTSA